MRCDWKSGQIGHVAEHNEIARRLRNAADYPTLQDFLTAGGTLPAGVFEFASQLTIGSGTQITGAGRGKTILRYTGPKPAPEHLIVASGDSIHMEGFSLDGGEPLEGYEARERSEKGGLFIDNASRVTVREVEIYNTNMYGLWIYRAAQVSISDVYAWGNWTEGIAVNGQRVNITGCHCYGNRFEGIMVAGGAKHINIANCTNYGNAHDFIVQDGAEYVNLTNCTSEGAIMAGFKVSGSENIGITNCSAVGCAVNAGFDVEVSPTSGAPARFVDLVNCRANANGYGFAVRAGCEYINIYQCRANKNIGNGFNVFGSNVRIKTAQAFDNGQGGVDANGVRVLGEAAGIRIEDLQAGNIDGAAQAYGLRLDTGTGGMVDGLDGTLLDETGGGWL